MKKMTSHEIQNMLNETGFNMLDITPSDQDSINSAILADYKESQLNMGAYKKSNSQNYSQILNS